ncbi:GntR family transcriptional regulator [Priestia endophytica]|uniref:GntR family transcriptional regulator n=1 Tax=Priestia endophytica TaxID=135735 RepID=UPI003D26C138
MENKRSLYKQIAQYIKEQIINEDYKITQPLPSLRYLSNHFNVNIRTVQNAYNLLERQGYIRIIQGKGGFINDSRSTDIYSRKKEIILELKEVVHESFYLGIKKQELLSLLDRT